MSGTARPCAARRIVSSASSCSCINRESAALLARSKLLDVSKRWCPGLDSIHRPLRKALPLRLPFQCSERLFVLRNVLPQHIPQSLGLLRAQKDGLVVANRHLVGAVARCQTKYKLEIPDADAHLHAV